MNLLSGFRFWLTEGETTIVLTRRGQPVSTAVTVGKWRTATEGNREIMRTSVTFGPFPVETEFDGARLAHGDLVETIQFPSMGKGWAGDTFIYNPEISFTRDA